ncbi:MAG: hypothetical protein FI715_11850 [SAR202 cluster bacterium]|jgi:hypothetical protein|nr:hypothetical protein [Dehalococcoidia bacterium]MQF92092.1 hypothetical protein [SAR202 cluster bacterium]PKB69588.1 MAG: hypothetical protein BZY77_04240 [SAR202 cluster bacterium Io17-Chloro-G5]MCH2500768.1 hypothetical protein [Dehalococcoidia bacterium]MQG15075.1 hypothetical protein [SAR202 cluster bacterium]|tara:strand:- start:747 stop:1220 length:474 start_codon:yes stop_codon:yes gene_type:complete
MTWRDTLEGLKQELTEVRTQRQRRVEEEDAGLQKERDDLSRMAKDLGVDELLAEMNATLLDGKGEIQTIIGWESDDGDPDLEGVISMNGDEPDDDDEDTDVITTILSWEEGGEMEIAVDLGLSDEGIYLQINEIEIRPERDALEQGLIVAFRDELDL